MDDPVAAGLVLCVLCAPPGVLKQPLRRGVHPVIYFILRVVLVDNLGSEFAAPCSSASGSRCAERPAQRPDLLLIASCWTSFKLCELIPGCVPGVSSPHAPGRGPVLLPQWSHVGQPRTRHRSPNKLFLSWLSSQG